MHDLLLPASSAHAHWVLSLKSVRWHGVALRSLRDAGGSRHGESSGRRGRCATDLDKLAIDVILTEGKLEPFVSGGLTVEDFQGPMKEVAAFIWTYWANPKFHGKLPAESIIRNRASSVHAF